MKPIYINSNIKLVKDPAMQNRFFVEFVKTVYEDDREVASLDFVLYSYYQEQLSLLKKFST